MYPVWGIDLLDVETAEIMQRFLRVVTLMSLCALIAAILGLSTGFYSGNLLWIGVFLPLIAYYATSSRSRIGITCFASSAGILAIIYGCIIVITLSALGDFVTCACNENCRVQAGIPRADALRVCSAQNTFRTLFWLHVIISAALVFELVYAAVLGFKLSQRDHFRPPLITLDPQAGPPVAFAVVNLPYQPAASAYTPYLAPVPVYTAAYGTYHAAGVPPPQANDGKEPQATAPVAQAHTQAVHTDKQLVGTQSSD